jgi:DNA-binding transcriptional LysR family regulator
MGEPVYEHAARVLPAGEALHSAVAAALAGERSTLRIGISQSTCYVLAAPLAHSYAVSGQASMVSFINACERGSAGGAWSARPRRLHKSRARRGIVNMPLFKHAWMLMADRDHSLVHPHTVTLDALDGADMIAWHQRWRAPANLERLWGRRQIKPASSTAPPTA